MRSLGWPPSRRRSATSWRTARCPVSTSPRDGHANGEDRYQFGGHGGKDAPSGGSGVEERAHAPKGTRHAGPYSSTATRDTSQ